MLLFWLHAPLGISGLSSLSWGFVHDWCKKCVPRLGEKVEAMQVEFIQLPEQHSFGGFFPGKQPFTAWIQRTTLKPHSLEKDSKELHEVC